MRSTGWLPQRAERILSRAPVGQAAVLSLVADRLSDVDALFRESLESPIRLVDEIGEFVGESGGKRVRPALHLLCARMCGYEGRHDVLMATVLELIHSATLIHDDIIDGATTRRGRPSVNHLWGNNITVLFGDYMLAKAMDMALDAGSLRVMRKLADVTLRMTEGEMLQTRYVGRLDLSVEEYLALVERKTAALFAGCCEIAGILAGQTRAAEEALREYGLNLGMAFQLVDDLLDFTGDAMTLGKPAASDLREGKATLALLDQLHAGSGQVAELARAIMGGNGERGEEIAQLTRILRESGAIERASQAAHRYAAKAAQGLSVFPDGPARRALEAIPETLVSRNR